MDLSNKNMVHIKKDGIEYLQFRKLLEFNNLINFYTLSKNNIDFTRSLEDEKKQRVDESYRKICDEFNIEKSSILRPHQSHTDKIEIVNNTNNEYFDVDGLITNKENINLMLTYADCTPILLYEPTKNIIGNVHSGWRGTIQKIGQKAVLKMIEQYDVNPRNIIACIGPCIGKCHFEVSEDVKEKFEQTFSYFNRNNDIIEISKENKFKYFIDTTLINRLMLEEIGIRPENIFESNICTVCNSKIIHSYRADGKKSGRNVAMIGLRSMNKGNIN